MSKKILVVDDERDIVDILAAFLKHEGYNVISAFDGEEGAYKAISEKPDLVIMDVMMPKVDGFGGVKIIKAQKETASIPIIMLTAKDQQLDKDKALALGINAYLVKLFDLEDLRNTVKQLIG